MTQTPAAGTAKAPLPSWRVNLRDAGRWRAATLQALGWLAAVTAVVQLVMLLTPGSPVFVLTESIPRGVYWKSDAPPVVERGRYVSWHFSPTQPWLRERYSHSEIGKHHAKQVGAVAGDMIVRDKDGGYHECHARATADLASQIPTNSRFAGLPGMDCVSLGAPLAVDSKGRPMTGWLEAQGGRTSYTLAPGEVWLHGPHARSLDSRYYGPVPATKLLANLKPLWLLPD